MDRMPGWFAPVLGTAVGGAGGFYVGKYEMNFNPPSILPWFVLATTVMGACAGLVVWFVEARKKRD